jgi:beta-alanine--pyruvate transaminase
MAKRSEDVMKEEAVQNLAPRPASLKNLDSYWMPFTANRQFKAHPRLFAAAEGMHYITPDGRKVLDGTAGLWCCNAGHARPRIVQAVQNQVARLDYAPSFQMGHPLAFETAARVSALFPDDLNHVFFTNSGSESVDTALKIAIAYQRAIGQGTRTRLIGRERGYHGVGFGGISIGGISGNRKLYGSLLTGVDHLPHTHDLQRNAYTRGQPKHGAILADELERIVALHDASNIAAVIVEPLAGSTGVLVPPIGYLQRLRDICTKHGILLIFDEVITGFGRLGAASATELFGVKPDMVVTAKALTNGVIPMGAVIARQKIYEAFMQGPESGIELPHGYTYSGHPVACAAALAALETYAEEDLFARAAELAPYFEDAAHGLKGLPHIIDIRNLGLVAGIELDPRPAAPGQRGYEAFTRCFEAGLLIRVTGDIIALSPPLIVSRQQIDELFGTLSTILKGIA